MAGMNCWQHKKCGRQPGGEKVGDLGICPVATATRADGLNHGQNGGRVCWVISGTFCGGKVQGTFASKMANCSTCDFYGIVKAEEGVAYLNPTALLKVLG
jgi:hypothetical protein